jgi:hypothetical protein
MEMMTTDTTDGGVVEWWIQEFKRKGGKAQEKSLT